MAKLNIFTFLSSLMAVAIFCIYYIFSCLVGLTATGILRKEVLCVGDPSTGLWQKFYVTRFCSGLSNLEIYLVNTSFSIDIFRPFRANSNSYRSFINIARKYTTSLQIDSKTSLYNPRMPPVIFLHFCHLWWPWQFSTCTTFILILLERLNGSGFMKRRLNIVAAVPDVCRKNFIWQDSVLVWASWKSIS